jgi:hypothetical protein
MDRLGVFIHEIVQRLLDLVKVHAVKGHTVTEGGPKPLGLEDLFARDFKQAALERLDANVHITTFILDGEIFRL